MSAALGGIAVFALLFVVFGTFVRPRRCDGHCASCGGGCPHREDTHDHP